MPEDRQQLLKLAMGIAAFGLVFSIWLAAVVFWMAKRNKRSGAMQKRLQTFDTQGHLAKGGGRVLRLWHDGKEATTIVPGLSNSSGIVEYLEEMRVQAGWTAPIASSLLGIVGIMAMVAAASHVLTGMIFVTVTAPIAVLIVVWIYITGRIARRTNVFERHLIDALELSARSLRAGHPLVGSFQLIAEEIPAPVGDIFAQVCQQQDLGAPMDEALRNVAEDHHSDDLKLFATSVVIQLRSGGNLADMMTRLANVIRERNRLARRVRVLTAQTQMSKRVLLAMPFLVFVILNIINPKYMQPLYTTFAGQMIMMAAAIGLLVGWLLMNWLSRLDA